MCGMPGIVAFLLEWVVRLIKTNAFVGACRSILDVSMSTVIEPSDYLSGLKAIYTIDQSTGAHKEVELVALQDCSLVQVSVKLWSPSLQATIHHTAGCVCPQVGIVLSNWGLSKLVPIMKNATVDGRGLASITSVQDILSLAPLSFNLVDVNHDGTLSEAEIEAAAKGSLLSRLVDKVELCRQNDGKLSRSVSIMMQNMSTEAGGKGKKGHTKAALFKSLEMQKKSRDLYVVLAVIMGVTSRSRSHGPIAASFVRDTTCGRNAGMRIISVRRVFNLS